MGGKVIKLDWLPGTATLFIDPLEGGAHAGVGGTVYAKLEKAGPV